jgi:pimeloyl-ACP methyl ester carboxylesterase
MASTIPVFEVEFDKHGNVFNPAQVQTVLNSLSDGRVTDLLVFAHGWNNDMRDARELYQALFEKIEKMLIQHHQVQLGARKFAAIAVLWPSKKFTDEELIPSGDAASAEPDELDPVLQKQLEDLKVDPVRLGQKTPADANEQAALERAQAQVAKLDEDEDAQRKFVEAIRSLLPRTASQADDGSDQFFTRDAIELLQDLARPVVAPPPTGQGGGALSLDDDVGTVTGEAAGIRDLWEGVKAGARRLLNFTTYCKMKERAGLVGKTGVADVLRQILQRLPQIKIHLIGHSFGGRLVTAVADSLGPQVKVNSLSLLQAAYSHNGLAERFDGEHDGFFRKVVSEKKVSGPILITHTKNDKAVGVAYPLASRVSHDNAAALFGDSNDPYGGMGRNGAQHTPVADNEQVLRVAGGQYVLQSNIIYNLNADEFIQDHSDICKAEVAHAILSAVATT